MIIAQATDKPVVAVWNFSSEDRSESAQALTRQLADLTRVRLAQTSVFRVVDKSTQEALFGTQADHLRYCDEEKCAIEGGKLLSADKLAFGNLMRFGDSCTVALRLFDIQTGVVEKTAAETGSCRVEEFPSLVSKLVYSFTFGAPRPEEELKKAMQPPPPPPQPSALSKPVDTKKIVLWTGVGVAATALIGGAILMVTAPKNENGRRDIMPGFATMAMGVVIGGFILIPIGAGVMK